MAFGAAYVNRRQSSTPGGTHRRLSALRRRPPALPSYTGLPIAGQPTGTLTPHSPTDSATPTQPLLWLMVSQYAYYLSPHYVALWLLIKSITIKKRFKNSSWEFLIIILGGVKKWSRCDTVEKTHKSRNKNRQFALAEFNCEPRKSPEFRAWI